MKRIFVDVGYALENAIVITKEKMHKMPLRYICSDFEFSNSDVYEGNDGEIYAVKIDS